MESAISFKINQHATLGILHRPESALPTAVLVVVGGPQYRVGSHRQFVQLSRFLAKQNIVSFRFDVRGMGDAAGAKQPFEQLDEDIKAATDCLLAKCPEVSKVVIWGLCDAASAALLYAHQDPRVTGLIVLNPWLKNTAAQSKTMFKYYYLQRLLSKSFWKKLVSGKINIAGSAKDVATFANSALKQGETQDTQSYQQKMLDGAIAFKHKTLIILSGNDLTAREFQQVVQADRTWRKWMKSAVVQRIDSSDHTFSTRDWKAKVEQLTIEFVKG